jgi:uncharacterized protein (UPF0333 family)
MKKLIFTVVFLIVVIFIILVFSGKLGQKGEINVSTEDDNKEITMFGDNKKMDDIRNRESIKKQQELIVQEVYLLEEKDRINAEKEEAIKQFDTQISKIEKSLETVRAEKVSF